MEKLEKHIRETLKVRRIAPSEHAWEKVLSQIRVESKQSGNKWFMYAAVASFVGIILASIFFFQTDTPSATIPQIVEEENTQEESIQPNTDNLIPLEIEQNQTEIVTANLEKAPLENSVSQEGTLINAQETLLEIEQEQPLKVNALNAPDELIAQKANEVAAHVALLETMNNEVSDSEVDSLLRAAQRQILSEQILKSNKVDAMALLLEVEGELDESFRNQIFEALKDGYLKLRTAVADRNN